MVDGEFAVEYTWKKGKSYITLCDNNGNGKDVVDISINISDTNAAVYGVKVGMKKDQAIKKIENATGLKVKSHTLGGEKFLCVAQKHYNDGLSCTAPICFNLKNGKVSRIGFALLC